MGRDAVADSGLATAVEVALPAFPGKVLLVRPPDRRGGMTVIRVRSGESGSSATRQEIGSLDDLPDTDVEAGEAVRGPIFLVCAYRGRTIYPAPVQAAEIAVRSLAGADGVGDLRLVSTTTAS